MTTLGAIRGSSGKRFESLMAAPLALPGVAYDNEPGRRKPATQEAGDG